jgi:hypothetical protein
LNRVLFVAAPTKGPKKGASLFQGVFVGQHHSLLKHLGNETGRLKAKNPAFLGFF